MITSQPTVMTSEAKDADAFSAATLAYYEGRAMRDWYNYVMLKFLEEEQSGRLTKAELARRIKKDPARLSRLLSSPSNWTIATLSNLLLGIAREEVIPDSAPVASRPKSNFDAWEDGSKPKNYSNVMSMKFEATA